MYPNYPCRAAQSCCNELHDKRCNLGRRNQSMINFCLAGQRVTTDKRVSENKPRSPKCNKRMAFNLADEKQQAKLMAAAEAIAQYEKLCIKANTNNFCSHVPKSTRCRSQVAYKQSPYATVRQSSHSPATPRKSSSSNQKISDHGRSSSMSRKNAGSGGLEGPQFSEKKSAKRRGKDKDLKVEKNTSRCSITRAESGYDGKSCAQRLFHQMLYAQPNQKYLKNKKNYQCQDDHGGRNNRMEVICEEQEEMMCSEEEEFNSSSCDSPQDRKIQESCADFLNIVNDSVLDTVQKSVETVLKEYFLHTFEKIDRLASQMVRNDCLMSKMYLDIMDKLNQSNEQNQRQFKHMSQFLLDLNRAMQSSGSGSVSVPASESTTGSVTASASAPATTTPSTKSECTKKCSGKNDPVCECGCKRGFPSADNANNTSNPTDAETRLSFKLQKPACKAIRSTAGGSDESPPINPSVETSGTKFNSSMQNSNGNNENKPPNTIYKSELRPPPNVGLVDTVITEEIRYFRNRSRIFDRDGLSSMTKTSKTAEAHTRLGQAADAAGADFIINEKHSKSMRSEKKHRNADLFYAGTRVHLKKKRSIR